MDDSCQSMAGGGDDLFEQSFGAGRRWIAAAPRGRLRDAPLLRRAFHLDGPVASAELLITGLGCFEATINGRPVGDHVMDPAQTDYEHRVLYLRHDVTDLLRSGANVIGVMLGDGWFAQDMAWNAAARLHALADGPCYGEPRLLCDLRVTLADGRRCLVTSDEPWRWMLGPVTDNNVYAGECYDARREMPGWDEPGFDDARWRPVEIVEGPCGRLEEQRVEPMRRIEEIRPVGVTEVDPACWVVDLGQNISGWLRISVDAPAGREIRLRFAEALGTDGRIDTASTGVFATHVEQIDRFIADGRGRRSWEPRFSVHGFRYVEILGWPGALSADEIVAVVVHTDLPAAGQFACSDERLTTLHRMAVWTHRDNIHGVPEDCPARERCGWLGDANVVAEMSLWNFDGRRFWEKYLDDIETTRRRFGGLPGVIAPGRRTYPGQPDWSAAFIMLPWYLYVHYGDAGVLAAHFEGMEILIEHFACEADGWILEGGFGDWFDPGEGANCLHTPPTLTTTLWMLRCSEVMTRAAEVLGRREHAERYARWPALIRAALIERFYDEATGGFGSQTADVMALAFEVVEGARADRVFDSLLRDIRSRDGHLNTGIMGVRFLFEVLTRRGRGATALAIMHQDDYPSFGNLIGRGATTLWEWWGEEYFNSACGPRSLNHPMFAGYDNWLFNTLAGIEPDPGRPGFEHILLRPHPIAGLDWVRCRHESPRGRIESNWRCADSRFEWDILVPEGATATATLPLSGRTLPLEPGRHELTDARGEQ